MAMGSIIRSAKSMPCGPPKPRKAVLDTVLVLQPPGRMRTPDRSRRCRRGTWCGRMTPSDRSAEIAAAGQESHVDARASVPSRVEAGVVVDAEIVALAGHDHVVVAVEPASWPAGRSCARPARRAPPIASPGSPCRRSRRPCGGTSQVTAASATPSMLGDDVLHLGRMLGRGIDEHVAVLARERRARPGLRDRNAPGRRCGSSSLSGRGAPVEAGGDVAALERIGRQHVGLGGDAHRRRSMAGISGRDLDAARAGGAAGLRRGSRRPPRTPPGRRTRSRRRRRIGIVADRSGCSR